MMNSVNAYLTCVAATLALIIGAAVAIAVFLLALVSAVVLLTCALAGIATGGAGFVACLVSALPHLGILALVLAAAVAVVTVGALIFALVGCAQITPFPGAVAGATPVGGELDSGAPVDCASARAMLARAQAALAAAEAREEAARAEAQRLERRVRNAQGAVAAAMLTLAGGLLAPWLVPGALMALAAATALLVRRTAALGVARAALVAAQAALVLAVADLAAAEALVLALCPRPSAPGGRDPGLAGGVLLTGRIPAALSLGVVDCGCGPDRKSGG